MQFIFSDHRQGASCYCSKEKILGFFEDSVQSFHVQIHYYSDIYTMKIRKYYRKFSHFFHLWELVWQYRIENISSIINKSSSFILILITKSKEGCDQTVPVISSALQSCPLPQGFCHSQDVGHHIVCLTQ